MAGRLPAAVLGSRRAGSTAAGWAALPAYRARRAEPLGHSAEVDLPDRRRRGRWYRFGPWHAASPRAAHRGRARVAVRRAGLAAGDRDLPAAADRRRREIQRVRTPGIPRALPAAGMEAPSRRYCV